jgi:beta-fructofuranosidase
MIRWEYQGPFYQSDRNWTLESEDAACPDFYPLGDSKKHMLLLHGHRPWRNITHYYIGEYRNERFFPEQHGRMSWLGGQLSGPESLIDDQGRNIFFGWLAESRLGGESLWGYDTEVVPGENDQYAWASVVSLPRVMTYRADGRLGIEPVPELRKLRLNEREFQNIHVSSGSDLNLSGIEGDVMELLIEIDPRQAEEVGVKVRCSPDNEEETLIVYNPSKKTLRVDFSKSTVADNVAYRGFFTREMPEVADHWEQVAPFELRPGEHLKLNIFLDKSVLEVFANGVQCITQRIYPSLSESQHIRFFSKGGDALVTEIQAWDIEQVMPW